MSKWKDTYPIACENYEHLFTGVSFGTMLASCHKHKYTEQEICVILRLKLKNIPVRHKLFQQIRHRPHLEWRYQVITVKYGSATRNRYILIYGKQEGNKIWEIAKQKYASGTLSKIMSKGFTEQEAREISKQRYDTNSLSAHIKRSGEIEGTRLYDEMCVRIGIESKERYDRGELFTTDYRNVNTYIAKYGDNEYARTKCSKDYDQWIGSLVNKTTLKASGMSDDEILAYYRVRSIRCVEYYLAMGYTEDEAEAAVSEVQHRGLDYFISKYGESDGTSRWASRNDMWSESYFDKSSEELLDIYDRKGSGNSGISLMKEPPPEIDGRIYVIRHQTGNFIKVGITSRTVRKRYSNFARNWVIILDIPMKFAKAKNIEQMTLKQFSDFKEVYNQFRSNETLNISCLDELLKFVKSSSEEIK